MDYPAEGGDMSQDIRIGAKTPDGFYTPVIFVRCEGQTSDEFCHVENPQVCACLSRLPACSGGLLVPAAF